MGETKKEPRKIDETKVLGRMSKELEALQPEQRERVLRYLVERFALGTKTFTPAASSGA